MYYSGDVYVDSAAFTRGQGSEGRSFMRGCPDITGVTFADDITEVLNNTEILRECSALTRVVFGSGMRFIHYWGYHAPLIDEIVIRSADGLVFG